MLHPILALALLLTASYAASAQNLSIEKVHNPHVLYAPAAELKKYPFPAVAIRRGGLANDAETAEIMDKIVYPVVNKSEQAIAAVVIDLLPRNPHPKTQEEIGFDKITVDVLWHGGGYVGALIEKEKNGHFAQDAHVVLLGADDDGCDDGEDVPESNFSKQPLTSQPPASNKHLQRPAVHRRLPESAH